MSNYNRSPVDERIDNFPQKHPVNEGYLRIGPLVGIPPMLRELGIDPTETIRGVGLDLSLFDDPENMIAFADMGRLLQECAVRAQRFYFGLLIGQRAGLASLGIIGQLSQHVPDVGSALRGLIRHLHLHDRGAVPMLSVEQDMAMLCYAIFQQGVKGTDQIYDGAIAIMFNIMRALCGSTWLPVEVLFSHRRPRDVGPYRRFFKAPLRFDMEQTGLIFAASWLKHPLPGADPNLRRQFEQRIAALENLARVDLIGQLRRILRILLVTHRTSLAQVAQLFSMHRRTLNRRLQAQGTTFQALMNEIRYEIARQLLENTDMSMGQIAVTLDYSDASAFTRAFRCWSGTTPTEWRARRGSRD